MSVTSVSNPLNSFLPTYGPATLRASSAVGPANHKAAQTLAKDGPELLMARGISAADPQADESRRLVGGIEQNGAMYQSPSDDESGPSEATEATEAPRSTDPTKATNSLTARSAVDAYKRVQPDSTHASDPRRIRGSA